VNVNDVAKAYHVLAGFIRDLGNAVRDDADGSAEAEKLLDGLDDVLELYKSVSSSGVLSRDESDDDACGDDADDEVASDDGELPEAGGVQPVVSARAGAVQYSARARKRQLAIPGINYVIAKKP